MRACARWPRYAGCAGSRPVPVTRPPIWLLVAMTGLGPFTMQILMPCLPALATALAVSYATAQLTLSIYLIGVAFGQLLYGPLSDRFGRKPLLSLGLVFYLFGSALAAVSPWAWLLVVARVMQALGGCAGLVLGRAMIRDAWSREQSASADGPKLHPPQRQRDQRDDHKGVEDHGRQDRRSWRVQMHDVEIFKPRQGSRE